MMHLAVAALLALAQNDKAQANGYDDAWKTGWTNHCRTVLGTAPKTDGFVIHVGDSITFSSAYGAWIRWGAGKTGEDSGITGWIDGFSVPGGIDATSTNGVYLATKDSPSSGRSFTAAGGIDTNEYINGNNNGVTAMPAVSDPAMARTTLSSGYAGTLQIDTVAAAFSGAQIAILMLGTNDVNGSRTPGAFIGDLGTIVTKLEFQHIVVVLSTIPPHATKNSDVILYNAQIRTYAQSHGLPLIDLYAEFLARQPTNWVNTLIDGGYHPTGDRAGYTIGSDPYADGGSATTHTTGNACKEVGYLLRTWLTVQKLKEVRSFVVQGQTPVLANPTTPTPPGPTPPGPTPSPSTPSSGGGGGGGGGKCGGSVAGPVSPWTLQGAALAALLLARAARKTGF